MTISVMLMLLGLLGVLGFVWCQSDVSSAVITRRVTFSFRIDRDSMVCLALSVRDSTLWFFFCDCIYSGLLTMAFKVSLALLA
jgi:hypothetical protein